MQSNSRVEALEQLRLSHPDAITWGRVGVAEYDFRSDIVTTPTLGMLAAIASTTHGDDVFNEDLTTIAFEEHLAALTGHEAAAFVLSGTMANQISLRALMSYTPASILCAANAHIIHFEAGGVALGGATVQPIRPRNGIYLTLPDIATHAVLPENPDTRRDSQKCPTRVISLENTSAGSVVPLDDLRAISTWAQANHICLHMDGARLWEAVAAGGAPTVRDYTSLCSAVSLDFSKGLGAPVGAAVVGSRALIERVKRIRKATGGGMRQSGMLVAPAWAALRERFCVDVLGRDEALVLGRVHRLARTVGGMWEARGGKLRRPVETNIIWLDLNAAGVSSASFGNAASKNGVKVDGGRLVLHYQISEAAVTRLEKVFDDVLGTGEAVELVKARL